MPVPKNLVWEQSSSTGTGNKTLTRFGGFARVSEAFSTGDAGSANPILFFANKDAASAEWEVVQGYMSDANTFVPVTVIASSNGGAAVTFTAGTKYVTNDVPAERHVYLDSNAAAPPTNDGAALGTTGLQWSDLFLASGGVIQFNGSSSSQLQHNNTGVNSAERLISTLEMWIAPTITGRGVVEDYTGDKIGQVVQVNGQTHYGLAFSSVGNHSSSAWWEFFKSRTTDGNTNAAVLDADEIMTLHLNADNGSYMINNGYLSARVDGTPSGDIIPSTWSLSGQNTSGDNIAVELKQGASWSPAANDTLALGRSASAWSDVFLASGGVINWNNGDVTATHSANTLAFGGASSGYTFDAVVKPASNDGAALGASGTAWSDVYFASGGVVNFNNGNFTFTHLNGTGLEVAGGHIYLADTNPAVNNTAGGWSLRPNGIIACSADGGSAFEVNRKTSDGGLVNLRQDGTLEGQITVSGTTVTYGSFCGSHFSQMSDGGILDIPRGTIVETIDEMCAWPGEANDQLARFKISDTPGSPRVYGVFMDWDGDDMDSNDAKIASLGAYLVRIAAGVTVQGGDLIESNGDGCGRVQADDTMRAATIGKVTSNTVIEAYSDGSYLVPCVLYCG